MFPGMNIEEYMESELYDCNTGCQKYSAWAPGNPTLCRLCSVMSLSEETHK